MTMTHFLWTTDMPLVRIAINSDQSLLVWVCGISRTTPAGLLRADRMGLLLDWLYADLGGEYSVEIINPDNTRQTGTVNLDGKPTPDQTPQASTPLSQWEPASPPRRAAQPAGQEPNSSVPVTLKAVGFAPSEQVRVAYVATEATAHPDTGDVVMQLPRPVVEALHDGEVILLGRTSGRMSLHRPLYER